MDITIESMLLLMVAAIAAIVVITQLTGQANGFTTFLGNNSDSANCNLLITQEKYGEANSQGCQICTEEETYSPVSNQCCDGPPMDPNSECREPS